MLDTLRLDIEHAAITGKRIHAIVMDEIVEFKTLAKIREAKAVHEKYRKFYEGMQWRPQPNGTKKNPHAYNKLRDLKGEQFVWAAAFIEVYGKAGEHYIRSSPERKNFLEKHYKAKAKAGDKQAQRVVREALEKIAVQKVMARLDDEPAMPKFSAGKTMTGRMASADWTPGGSFQNINRIKRSP